MKRRNNRCIILRYTSDTRKGSLHKRDGFFGTKLLWVKRTKKAASGKTIAQGGILPDDNVRIYVLMDLNADIQVRRTKNAKKAFADIRKDYDLRYMK